MYYLCKILLLLYIVSIMLAAYNALLINQKMRDWVESFGQTTHKHIVDLSNSSTKEALYIFRNFFFGSALILFFLDIAFNISTKDSSNKVISFAYFTFLYTGASINALLNVDKSFSKEFKRIKEELIDNTTSFILLSTILLIFLIALSVYVIGEIQFNYGDIFVIIYMVLVGILAIGISIIVKEFIQYFLLLMPAMVAIAYLWLVIRTAQFILRLGKVKIYNLLIIYSLVVTIYLTYCSWSNVSPFCSLYN